MRWTDESRQILHELLRKGHPATKIAETMGIRVNDVYNILKYTDDKRLKSAWTRNKNTRSQTEKKSLAPTRTETLHDQIVAEFGCSPEEYSVSNMAWFYADEIDAFNATGKVASTVRKTLFKYNLIERPSDWPRVPRGRAN